MISKKLTAIALSALMAVSMTACGNNNAAPAQTPSAATSVETAQHELKDEISQADWDANRQYVELSTGIKMAYVEMGDENGKPVILQHGMTDNSRVWSLSAPYFAKAGYHVYMPDLRGHGYSDKPEVPLYTVRDYATDLNAFMEAMNLEKADLVGHSLGSMTMQMFMFMFPERCDHVVLVASTPVTEASVSGFSGTYMDMKDMKEDEHPDDDYMAAWYTNANPVDEEFLSNVMRESQQLPAHSWKAIGAGVTVDSLEGIYPAIDSNIPVLIIHGTADAFFSDEAQEELCKLLPSAEYSAYDGIGHNVQYEVPERLANDIMAFIEK